ncbi:MULTISPECIES: hypothetical protein [Thermomonospora]|uniref:Secreted protein n=1 Tax=Thermomonospora cellulosilytica TaxID=1411118 RepID=A0A7W3MUL1_9ACTN|nr:MULTISPECIES: hypothetical protein [Thermomonospora]MBA9002107.1 hypothetical protein [Thermomonospora cellulosilytica]
MDDDRLVRGRWARRAATMLVSGAVAAGGLAALAAPAHAAPSGCTRSLTWNAYTLSCAEGDGQYRAGVECVKYVNLRWYYATRYGEWVAAGPGGSSRAVCPTGYGAQRGFGEVA